MSTLSFHEQPPSSRGRLPSASFGPEGSTPDFNVFQNQSSVVFPNQVKPRVDAYNDIFIRMCKAERVFGQVPKDLVDEFGDNLLAGAVIAREFVRIGRLGGKFPSDAELAKISDTWKNEFTTVMARNITRVVLSSDIARDFAISFIQLAPLTFIKTIKEKLKAQPEFFAYKELTESRWAVAYDNVVNVLSTAGGPEERFKMATAQNTLGVSALMLAAASFGGQNEPNRALQAIVVGCLGLDIKRIDAAFSQTDVHKNNIWAYAKRDQTGKNTLYLERYLEDAKRQDESLLSG